jgi:ABC-type antimicrobial peptide transport system permease subunit
VLIRGRVLKGGLRLVFIGVASGIPPAVLFAWLLRARLFGVNAADPATITGIALLFAVVGSFASYLPARRATRIDPLLALREE